MPPTFKGRAAFARAGLAVHITAPHINPGFVARITLEMYNHGPWKLQLIPGKDLVCQVIFYKLTSPVSQKVINAFGTYKKQSTPYPARRMRLVSDWGVETSSREIDKVLYGRPAPKRSKTLKRSERGTLPKLKPFVREKHDRFD